MKDFFSFSLSEIICRGTNWLLMIMMPFFLSSKEYGKINLIFVFITIISSFILYGQHKVVLRYYHEFVEKEKFIITTFSLWFTLANSTLIVLFIISFFLNFDKIFGFSLSTTYLFLLFIIILLSSFRQLYLSLLISENKSKKYFIDSIVFQILKLTFIILFLFNLENFKGYILGFFISIALISCFEVIIYVKENNNYSYDKKLIKKFWLFGWPFVFHFLGGNILSYMDRFLIEQILNLSDVGVYSFSYNLGSSLAFLYAPFVVFFEPRMSNPAG